jgi:TolB protein
MPRCGSRFPASAATRSGRHCRLRQRRRVAAKEIIKADLERSGAFKIIDAGVINDVNNIDYSGWKAKGADALVVGTVDALADGRYDVRYKLLDTVKQAKISNLDKA